MSNELTDVRCPCGAEFQADSYDAGFIAGSGMCQNCDAALPPKDICTCPSGNGSLRHPCPAHPAVEQAGGDERDFQAEGAQEVPSPVSQEYDRHLISLLRKGEALPGHQEEAADEIERLRDWNDHLNNTVLPNILNPTFLMLMKGGERLLDLCTKDGEFIGVSLNDMKDVFDWMVTHARIAPDQAALAQPSPKYATCNGSKVVSTTDTDHNGDYIEAPCPKCGGTGEADSGGVHPWGEPVLIPCDCETEQAEPELEPHIPAQNIAEAAIEQLIKSGAKHYQEFHFDLHLDGQEGARPVVVTVAFSDGPSAHELRMKAEQERDAALAEVERLRQFERICEGLPQDAIDGGWTVQGIRGYAKHLEDQLKVALARVAELEKQERPEVPDE
ncbi:hypothetical protein [Pseudomonas aeruginosa]|uniref:hypothetical protein n=1 Tax=Pseudomonas aeruginosa TaxID=287 RepID=UPI003109A3E2